MTPVKVPTVPCAEAAPGQETAATNATAAKDSFDMLEPPSFAPLYLERGRNSKTHGAPDACAKKSWYPRRQLLSQDTASATVRRERVSECCMTALGQRWC